MPPLFAASVLHRTADVEATRELLCELLGFELHFREQGDVMVGNGSVAVRLTPSHGQPAAALVLELRCKAPEATARDLAGHPAVERIEEPEWVAADRKQVRVTLHHGLELVLAHTYDEDELGVTPPLPTSLAWAADAIEALQGLLREVPVDFRGGARVKATARAELLSIELGEVSVDFDRAVQGIVQITPAFQLERLREALRSRGLDPARWHGDFSRDGDG